MMVDRLTAETARHVLWWAAGLTAAGWLALMLDVQGPVRLLLGLPFVLMTPGIGLLVGSGLCRTFLIALLAVPVSLCLASLVAVALMFTRTWSVELAATIVAVLACAPLAHARIQEWRSGRRRRAEAEPDEVLGWLS
jgi:hypothetical protein